MKYFLAKTDPQTYSLEDLKKDKTTTWDGVHNYSALIFIKQMSIGDRVFIYHSMVTGSGGPSIVGLAKVVSNPKSNPQDPRKSVIVDLQYIREFKNPITLKEIKDSNLFDDWSLIKQSRLSTMPVPEKFIKWVQTAYKSNVE